MGRSGRIVLAIATANVVFAAAPQVRADDRSETSPGNALAARPRFRAAVSLPNGGFGLAVLPGGVSVMGGPGIGFHLGVQLNRLVGVYVSAHTNTLAFFGHAEVDGIADLTFENGVQVGAGVGVSSNYNVWFNGGSGALFGVSMPMHVAWIPSTLRYRNGTRTGFRFALDVAPGIALGGVDVTPYDARAVLAIGPAVSGTASLGWEWF